MLITVSNKANHNNKYTTATPPTTYVYPDQSGIEAHDALNWKALKREVWRRHIYTQTCYSNTFSVSIIALGPLLRIYHMIKESRLKGRKKYPRKQKKYGNNALSALEFLMKCPVKRSFQYVYGWYSLLQNVSNGFPM